MKSMRVTALAPLTSVIPVLALLFQTGPATSEEVNVTRYDQAQHLVCKRDGKVVLDRNPVFRLKVLKTSLTEEYSFRDGRVGARKGKFRLRPGEGLSCSITPAEGEAAKPYREFDGPHMISCKDNDIPIIGRVVAENLVERGTETSVVYEYNIYNGPPSKQKIMLSADGADCFIRSISD